MRYHSFVIWAPIIIIPLCWKLSSSAKTKLTFGTGRIHQIEELYLERRFKNEPITDKNELQPIIPEDNYLLLLSNDSLLKLCTETVHTIFLADPTRDFVGFLFKKVHLAGDKFKGENFSELLLTCNGLTSVYLSQGYGDEFSVFAYILIQDKIYFIAYVYDFDFKREYISPKIN